MLTKVRSFFSAHRAARAAVPVLLALLALVLLLRPYGTQTYLVLGMDNYGSLDETGRSDVMMLVQLNFTRSRITGVTFARDMFIDNEEGRETKINTIVRSSSEESLVSALEKDFQLDIDGWFRVNFTTVIELVDALGGAKVELTEKEVAYINRNVGYYNENPLAEGECLLNGAQALCYARCRQLDNDIGRGQRQSKLLSGMVNSVRHMSLARIGDVFSSLKHAWRSSLSAGEQVRLLSQVIWLRGAKVESVGVPFEGTWRYGNSKKGDNGILIKQDENTRLLHEALGLPSPAPVSES